MSIQSKSSPEIFSKYIIEKVEKSEMESVRGKEETIAHYHDESVFVVDIEAEHNGDGSEGFDEVADYVDDAVEKGEQSEAVLFLIRRRRGRAFGSRIRRRFVCGRVSYGCGRRRLGDWFIRRSWITVGSCRRSCFGVVGFEI